ncbi:MAG: deoxyribose-phosphate aldolase [Sphingobacteriales bacterium]|nr:deoxyribose-phosphate aldolase [Sphingobacteriales bacterium]
MPISRYIDHTLLKAAATEDDILQICKEAAEYGFYAVCVNSCYVPLCKESLAGLGVKIAAVIGFPLGAMSNKSKTEEAKNAVADGAEEVDMVINIGLLKSGKHSEVESEIRMVKQTIGKNTLKVIIETCYLSDEEKKIATQLTVNAGADFVKTSTGFGPGGATIEDVILMKSVTKGSIQIKASGGIRDYETAKRYIDMGVTRIGTSNGIQIVTGQKGMEGNY